MLQQVGSSNKESRVTVANTLIGDSRCQVGLTATAGADQDQPTFRLSGKGFSRLVSSSKTSPGFYVAAPALWYQVLKGKPGQGTQIAVTFQPGIALFLSLLLSAAAGYCFAKIGMSYGNIGINKANPVTNRTDW